MSMKNPTKGTREKSILLSSCSIAAIFFTHLNLCLRFLGRLTFPPSPDKPFEGHLCSVDISIQGAFYEDSQ